jgi:hypothetical protein
MPAAARIAEFCSISLLAHPELIAGGAGVSLLSPATRKSNAKLESQQARGEDESMPSLKRSVLAALDDFRASGLLRPAAEKFAGAWLACFLVMARGDVLAGLSFEHIRLASICGIVGAAATVALLAQMTRTSDSLARQATISAVVTFIGDVFAHPSHFGPQWAEPLITAAVSAAIAVAVWHGKRLVKRLAAPQLG